MRPLLAGCLSILIWLFTPAATFFAEWREHRRRRRR
jgi:hypothetical protein